MGFHRRVRLVGLGALLAWPACSAAPVRYISVLPPTAQARSFLGDTLWNLPLDPMEGQRRIQLLFRARDEVADHPNRTSAKLLLARRTIGVGRLREAVEIYNEAIAADPVDLRLPRRRGELLLLIRELDLAIQDLTRAARGSLTLAPESEFNELVDGSIYETTLQYSTLFYLGIALYLKADFVQARDIHLEALKRARNADEVVQTALWVFFATRRLGKQVEAREILGQIRLDMPVTTGVAEHQLLLAYRGDITQETLPVNLREPLKTASDAMYAYGIGFALLMLGREEEAALAFQHVRLTPDWTTLPYLAAEAELFWIRRSRP